jgi:hypothetical protein
MNEQRIIRPNPGFIIPSRRFIDVGMAPSRATLKGRYKLVVRDAWGGVRRQTDWFDNIILDTGLNRMGTGAPIAGAAIGTGTSTPVASQTGLDTQTTYTTTSGTGNGAQSALGSSPYNNTYTAVYRTALGALNGNYYEVGVGWASGSMFSRALILDGGGSPTFVSVASTEQLDIVYELSIYPPLVDTSNSVTISGVTYTVTGRASSVNSTINAWSWAPTYAAGGAVGVWSISGVNNAYSGSIGAITALPAGTYTSNGSAAVVGSYSNNSLTRSARSTYGLTDGNVSGGIKSVMAFWKMACFQYEFNPVLPKDATKTLTLDYSMTWARRP